MKRHISILLAMSLCGTFLAGCGSKNSTDTNADGNGAINGAITSSNSESDKPSVETSKTHNYVASSTFEVNDVRFWHRDDMEMECLLLEEHHLAEITLDGVTLHIQVEDQADHAGWFERIVQRGQRGASASGDLCYQAIDDDTWEVATDNGKLIILFGDKDTGDGWKAIAQAIEWTAIVDSEPVEVAGTEETFNLEHDGIDCGSIKVSGVLSSDRKEFNFGNGDIRNWSYENVSAGGTCTITPSDACKYCIIELTAWNEEDGEYSPVRYEFSPWHKLYADGQASDLACGDTLELMPLATSEHSAHFVFGNNMNIKSPFGNSETCSFVLKTDGTMYRLDVDFYDESGESVASFVWPFFVH